MALKPSQIALLTGVAIVGAISFTWFRTASRAGEFTTLAPVFDGTCTDVGGLPGSEDIVLDRVGGRMFISSDDRRATAAGTPKRGGIFVLPLEGAQTVSARNDATKGIPAAFHPQGLSRFVGTDGKATVMVVNHPKAADYTGTVVEIYDEAPDNTLTHRRTVAINGLTRINDIAATGPDSFYATSETDLKQDRLTELWAFVADNDRSGAIWHFDGQVGKKLVSGISFANSLALTRDGKVLYASGTMSRGVFIYDRDPATNAIKQRSEGAFVGTFVDNLDVEDDGRLWIGAHPKLLTFMQHADNPNNGAPSQIIILEPAASGQGGRIDQVYLKDKDSGFSGASVAVRSGDTMVLGSVFEPGIRVCKLPAVWKQSVSHPAQRLIDTSRDVVKQEAEKAAEKAAEAKADAGN